MDSNAIDFWVLTAACEARAPISWLAATNRSEVFNLPDLDCTGRQLVDCLERLVSEELILVEHAPWPRRWTTSRDVRTRLTPSRAELIDALTEETRTGQFSIYYGLTHAGGACWESKAHPAWEKFVDQWLGPDLDNGAVVAHDRALVERWIEALPYVEQGNTVVSVAWRPLEPWPATYWKTLLSGFEARFRLRGNPASSYETPPDWVRELRSDASRWYTWLETQSTAE